MQAQRLEHGGAVMQQDSKMSNHEIGQRAEEILNAYRNHVENDLGRAIEDIGRCVAQVEGADKKKEFFTDFLWSKFGEQYVKPPRSGSDPQPGFDLIIRAWARFGPPDHLPAYLFSMLGLTKDQHDFWEREILPSFRDSLQKEDDRFSDQVVKAVEQTMHTTGRQPDGSLRSQFETLVRVASQILYGRFRKTLGEPATSVKEGQPKTERRLVTNEAKKPAEKDELAELLQAVDIDPKLAVAIRKCGEYLESDDPFHAKAAGGLLRSAIDSVNRSAVAELVKITGVPFEGKDKDELHRQYFVKVGFINEHEKQFFTVIYGLISNESTHQLDAPKETMLLMERTVTGYLMLVLRRLLERKGGKLPKVGTVPARG